MNHLKTKFFGSLWVALLLATGCAKPSAFFKMFGGGGQSAQIQEKLGTYLNAETAYRTSVDPSAFGGAGSGEFAEFLRSVLNGGSPEIRGAVPGLRKVATTAENAASLENLRTAMLVVANKAIIDQKLSAEYRRLLKALVVQIQTTSSTCGALGCSCVNCCPFPVGANYPWYYAPGWWYYTNYATIPELAYPMWGTFYAYLRFSYLYPRCFETTIYPILVNPAAVIVKTVPFPARLPDHVALPF